ncbi:MAG TPA: hypothetical protein VHB02_16570, partial [Acidimicrobiales bacterium]|nr:hypothetical protein [Acidimicrobiales bacterium]
SWHHVLSDFSYAGYVVAVLIVVVVVLAVAHRLRAVRAERAAGRGRHAAVGPAAAPAAQPPTPDA